MLFMLVLQFLDWMPQAFFIQKNIFVFTMAYSCDEIFIHTLCFFIITTISTKNNCFNKKNFNRTPPVSFFILLTTSLFGSSHWVSWINTKIKYFIIISKILINIFGFNFIHKTYMVLKFIWNNLLCCLRALHQFYFSCFPLFYHTQHCSLICTTFFHPLFHPLLNSTYGLNHCDWLKSNTWCSFNPSLQ